MTDSTGVDENSDFELIDPARRAPPPSLLGKRKRDGDQSIDQINSGKRQGHHLLHPLVDCRACGESVEQAYTAPCEHKYCDECMQQMFTLAMKDETMFPPRCCRKPFPLAEAKTILPQDLQHSFEQKQEELEDAHKVYCHVPACSAYIEASHRLASDNFAKCSDCNATTCTICKGPSHVGDCPEDEDRNAVLQAAKAAGWQTCKPCGRILELVSVAGCYSMREGTNRLNRPQDATT